MAKKTYKGSCHCGRVTIEADIDLSAGTGKCNCTICWKMRRWGAVIKPAAFRLLTGQEDLSDYSPGSGQGHNVFCKNCGIRPYSFGNVPEIGGDFVSINLCCLDDLDPAELATAPVHLQDGRANAWWNAPAEARHL